MPDLRLSVDQRSGYPVYQQIAEQIRRAVALGILAPGDQLPTVKQLSSDLLVNASTVARALRELEYQGVIHSQPGRGSFVRNDGVRSVAVHAAEESVNSALDAAVREARSLGVGEPTLRELLDRIVAKWYAS